MLGDDWRGEVTDLLDWIADAEYQGIEITNVMIGQFYDRPAEFAEQLQSRSLELAAFAYSSDSGFTDPAAWHRDIAGARRAIEFLAHFDGACLGLAGAASTSADEKRAKLDHAIVFYHAVGRRAQSAGIPVNVHPHSHHGSLLESTDEYQYLLDNLDPDLVSFGPDTGHIVRGGQDLLACLRAHIHRIAHLHLKDVTEDGEWAPLGEGICDFPAVMELLQAEGYEGWIVAEEESDAARADGIAAIRHNRRYLRSIGY